MMGLHGLVLMMFAAMAAKRFEIWWAWREGRLSSITAAYQHLLGDIDISTHLILEQNATLTPGMSLPIIFKTLSVRGKTGGRRGRDCIEDKTRRASGTGDKIVAVLG